VVESKRCDQNIIETLKLVERMVELAQQGDADREDVACGVLYGVMLDSAFKIKKLAELEKESHIQKGWWKQA
jgi:hypothetical protein